MMSPHRIHGPPSLVPHRLLVSMGNAELQKYKRMAKKGELEELDRGLFAHPHEPRAWETLISIAMRYPKLIIWGASAMEYHGLGPVSPPEVQVGIPPHSWAPRTRWPAITCDHFARPDVGVIEETIDGVKVRMASPERCVVDGFRRPDIFPLEITVEALRSGLADRKINVEDLRDMAEVLGESKKIDPFIIAFTVHS